jgi:hypothetical protein
MAYFAVVFVFPLLLAVLSLGNGLLLGRLAGVRLPALLVLPVGFGTLVVVAQFTTRAAATAPLTPWFLVALALLGFAVARKELTERWRARRRGFAWGPLAALATYAIVSAPILGAGRLTFPGYLLDTTAAVQMMGAEWLLHHGNNYSAIAQIPGYGQTLVAYFGNGYPTGGHAVWAAVGWLSGQDLLWLYSPFQAFELALCSLVLGFIAARAGLGRIAAAVAGLVAAVPALVFSYALMGSIKEITALPMLLLMGALLVIARQLAKEGGLRATLPFAVAGAAAIGAIGIAASPWVLLFGAGTLLVAVPVHAIRRRELSRLLVAGAGLAVATAVLALPTLIALSKTLSLAEGVSSSDASAVSDPGNLLRPLRFVQALGVWLGESHRIEPRYLNQTYVLIGVVVFCLVAGLLWLLRRRAWAVLAFVAISFLVHEVLLRHGTEWADAKLLVLLSPVLVLVAVTGAFRGITSRLPERVLVVALVAGAVLASDAMAYHGTNLAPTGRYTELKSIGERFSGQEPTLTPDFDEYALYLLRTMRPTGPGLAYLGPFSFVNGGGGSYGHSYDLDAIAASSVQSFKMIVMRRSPERSRPPSNFKLVWSGRYYLVWRRDGPPPLEHHGLGTPDFQAASVAPCPTLRRLADEATRDGGELAFAVLPQNVAANMAIAAHSPSVVQVTDLEGRPELGYNGPGAIETGVRVSKPGEYELWLGGYIDTRGLQVLLNGRLIGDPSGQSGDDGNMIYVKTLKLSAGNQIIRLVRGGGGLQPGNNAGSVIDGIVFEPVAAERESVQTIRPSNWHSLCGQSLDWVEVVRSS